MNRDAEQLFLKQLVEKKDELVSLLDDIKDHWGEEDLVYRFYHNSFKVYWIQETTQNIVELLQSLAPDQELDGWFDQIVAEGTGKKFEMEHNQRWLEETRPLLEAFWHAKYFLEQAVKYAGRYERPPGMLESGYAALLTLYGWR